MTATAAGVAGPEYAARREELLAVLTRAHSMEIETVMSYIANSVDLDGLRAREIEEALEADVAEKLAHERPA